MQITFLLYKYFPFGGLQRDFLRIAQACQQMGHGITVLTISWEGEQPPGFDIRIAPIRALTRVGLYRRFTQWAKQQIAPNSVVVGFNKMPGLDFYYAADPCFAEKAKTLRGWWYPFTSRYRHFMAYERAVFSPESATQILMISQTQLPLFQQHYGTPIARFHMLPPGVARDRQAPENASEIREDFRKELDLTDNDFLVLLLGSDFKRKGLDRILLGVANLNPKERNRVRLIAIGQDDPTPFYAQASALGINHHVQVLSGRSDISRFLLGADLLAHPAYHENTGTVLLEALAAGLPVLTTENCGYAHYIHEANAGIILPMPFNQSQFNEALKNILKDRELCNSWRQNAVRFSRTADIYSMPQRAAEIITATR